MSDCPDTAPETEGAVVGDRPSTTRRAHRRLRHIRRALTRLGLLDILGHNWVRIDPETGTISFDDVPAHRFLMLLLHLQDLGDDFGGNDPMTALPPADDFATTPVKMPFVPGRTTTGPHLGGRR